MAPASLFKMPVHANIGSFWSAVSIDDRWQLEQWGADSEALQALEARQRDFFVAAHFLELLS